MSQLVSKWNYPTTVRFGAGRIAELPEVLEAAGIRKPLFVTDPGLAKLPIVADTLAVLDRAGVPYGLFSDVKPNPVHSNLVAFQQGQTRPVWDFEDIGDWWTRANHDAIAPIIAVPTTAGTGSEVGRAGVITNEETHTKKVIFHPKLLPAIVIADPALSAGMPPFITAGTGMDALAHCLEALCAPGYHPMADGIAIEGIRLVLENLPKAFTNGQDLTARAHMMSAAAMGAAAFQKGLGAIHSLSHPIGALYDTHHGMTNAVFMPYVLNFNRSAIEEKIERLARYCGINGGFDGFFQAVIGLRRNVNVPHTLGEFLKGVEMDDGRKATIAAMAVVDPTAGGNPIPLTEENVLELLEDALIGNV
jgi:alcohol dehydrogenase class IV